MIEKYAPPQVVPKRRIAEPGSVKLVPWRLDGAMNAYFHNRGRVSPPPDLLPDGKPHPFTDGGVQYFYLADVDDDGPFVAVFLDPQPLPFTVALRCRPEHPRHYAVRCAECVRRWVGTLELI